MSWAWSLSLILKEDGRPVQVEGQGQRAAKIMEDMVLYLNTVMGNLMVVFNLYDTNHTIIIKDAYGLKQDILQLAQINGMEIDFNP